MNLMRVLPAIDSALGRLDIDSLSDQTLMELLIEGIEEDWKVRFEDSDQEDLRAIEEWDTLGFDADGKVERIHMSAGAGGSVAFQYLPKSVKEVDFSECMLTGSVEVSLLPDGLELFNVMLAGLSGTFDFAELPSHLVVCDISDNSFHGSADFTNLPAGLTELELRSNNFTGTLSPTALPKGLAVLGLNDNSFHGSLQFSTLPRSMYEFRASDNEFSGTLDWENLPPGLDTLWLQGNKFTGELRLEKNFEKLTVVDVADNLFEGIAIVHSDLQWITLLGGNKIVAVLDEGGKVCQRAENGAYVEG